MAPEPIDLTDREEKVLQAVTTAENDGVRATVNEVARRTELDPDTAHNTLRRLTDDDRDLLRELHDGEHPPSMDVPTHYTVKQKPS